MGRERWNKLQQWHDAISRTRHTHCPLVCSRRATVSQHTINTHSTQSHTHKTQTHHHHNSTTAVSLTAPQSASSVTHSHSYDNTHAQKHKKNHIYLDSPLAVRQQHHKFTNSQHITRQHSRTKTQTLFTSILTHRSTVRQQRRHLQMPPLARINQRREANIAPYFDITPLLD
jgi:hypothetical protein